MKVGDVLRKRPWTGQGGHQELPPQPCRVVYIHPKGRFYTVEFTYEDRGVRRAFRETYPLAGRIVAPGYGERPELINDK